MKYKKYIEQIKDWPATGRHIMANYDSDSISVYQAYRPSIAEFAVKNQKFGGDFSFERMSWIKPNFLWMMYRSGWATKRGQERILNIRIKRLFFEEILEHAVASSFDEKEYKTREEWQNAVDTSQVRLQWDPDHEPNGNKSQRRAIQIGLKGSFLFRYGNSEIVYIKDVTDFVEKERENIKSLENLVVPEESVYKPGAKAADAIGLNR